jgi:hypothetical protein
VQVRGALKMGSPKAKRIRSINKNKVVVETLNRYFPQDRASFGKGELVITDSHSESLCIRYTCNKSGFFNHSAKAMEANAREHHSCCCLSSTHQVVCVTIR